MTVIDTLSHGWDVFEVGGGRMEIEYVAEPVNADGKEVDPVFKDDAAAIAHVVMLADQGNPACREALKKVVQSWNLDGCEKSSALSSPPGQGKSVPHRPDHWAALPEYPVEDWKYEVANDDTRDGYWAWVESQQDMNKEDSK